MGTIVSLLGFYRVPSRGTTMVLLGCYPGTTAGLLLVYYWLTGVLQNCTEVLLWYRCIGVLLGYYWTLGTTCALIGHCWVLLVHYCGITVVEKGSIGITLENLWVTLLHYCDTTGVLQGYYKDITGVPLRYY